MLIEIQLCIKAFQTITGDISSIEIERIMKRGVLLCLLVSMLLLTFSSGQGPPRRRGPVRHALQQVQPIKTEMKLSPLLLKMKKEAEDVLARRRKKLPNN